MFRPQRFAPRDSHVRSLCGLAYSAARSACPRPARRSERRTNAHCSRKLSEFGARPGYDDDLVFDSVHEVLHFQYLICLDLLGSEPMNR